jgi:hypothetical protein
MRIRGEQPEPRRVQSFGRLGGDVISVTLAVFGRMARDEPIPGVVIKQAADVRLALAGYPDTRGLSGRLMVCLPS